MNTDRPQITSLTVAAVLTADAVAPSVREATQIMQSVVHRATATVHFCRNIIRATVTGKASVFAYELFNLTYDTIEFVDEIGVIAVLPKRGDKSSVIPNSSVLFSTEPLEHFEAMSSKLSQNRTRVMQFIRR